MVRSDRSATQARPGQNGWRGLREWLGSWSQDLTLAVRGLRARPGFAVTVLLTLALGIGANAAIFSVVNAVLLRQMPFSEPDRLLYVWETYGGSSANRSEASYPDFLDWRARTHAFSGLAGYQNWSALLGGDRPVAVVGAQVTTNLLDVLRVRPVLGRGFVDGEDAVDAPKVAMLAYAAWERQFGKDPKVVGTVVPVNGAPTTIIGVLPSGVQFNEHGIDLIVPIQRNRQAREQRGNHWIRVIGRLRDGATLADARRELSAIMRELATEYPSSNTKRDVGISTLREMLVGSIRPVMLLLYGAVGVMLLVACANVANLLLMRGADRRREIAVRMALGAGRGRLVRQLLTETVVLSLLGSVAGLAIARLGVAEVLRTMPAARLRAIAGLASASVDARVIVYSAAVAIAAALVAGLVPALRVTSSPLSVGLREGDRGAARGSSVLRDGLVVAEVALTVLLLSGAALFGRSLVELLSIQPGFRTEHLLTATVLMPDARYPTPESRNGFYDRVVERLRESPEVQAVGLTTKLPFDIGNSLGYHVVGHPAALPGQTPDASYRQVNPEYFAALGVPLLDGRWFTTADDDKAPHVAVINRALAEREFPGEEPVGRYFEHVFWNEPTLIVGVVGDVAIGDVDEPIPPTLYLPYAQAPQTTMRLVVRVRGDVPPVIPALRAAVRAGDAEAVVSQPMSMDSFLEQTPSVFMRRFPLLLVGSFAAATLMLSVVGVYGVVSYSVRQRTRELGIRLALGAAPRRLMALVLRHGVVLGFLGAATGIICVLAIGRLVEGMLYRVDARDPLVLSAAALALAATTVVAALLPARRATRVDPAITLRAE